jgi:hypothetical protein
MSCILAQLLFFAAAGADWETGLARVARASRPRANSLKDILIMFWCSNRGVIWDKNETVRNRNYYMY